MNNTQLKKTKQFLESPGPVHKLAVKEMMRNYEAMIEGLKRIASMTSNSDHDFDLSDAERVAKETLRVVGATGFK